MSCTDSDFVYPDDHQNEHIRGARRSNAEIARNLLERSAKERLSWTATYAATVGFPIMAVADAISELADAVRQHGR